MLKIHVVLVFLTVPCGCLPAGFVAEGAKQLGGYAIGEYRDSLKEKYKYYTDKEICLSSTLEKFEWDSSIPAKGFVEEAKKRNIKNDCRKNF